MPAAKPLGRPREIELRAVLDAILYITRTGCQWRMLPKDFPPFTTVQGYFYDWRDNRLFETINFTLHPWTPCQRWIGFPVPMLLRPLQRQSGNDFEAQRVASVS
jgi:transposase